MLIAVICFIGGILFLSPSAKKTRVLFDFESADDLKKIHWKCHTLFHLSPQHATHGRYCLQMTCYPSDYPGFYFFFAPQNWTPYSRLCFDIYNSEKSIVRMTAILTDRIEWPEHKNKFRVPITLKPGINHVCVEIKDACIGEGGENHNLTSITRLLLIMPHISMKKEVYIDYIRLVS